MITRQINQIIGDEKNINQNNQKGLQDFVPYNYFTSLDLDLLHLGLLGEGPKKKTTKVRTYVRTGSTLPT